MNVCNRERRLGMTLVEVMLVMCLLSVLGVLVARTMSSTSRFYSSISTESRETASAILVLEKVKALCFGLPKSGILIQETPSGRLLGVQQLESISPSGQVVYSTDRVVIESGPQGVLWWELAEQNRALGSALANFPQTGQSRILLGPDWSFEARFSEGRYPLRLQLTSPGPKARRYFRIVSGEL